MSGLLDNIEQTLYKEVIGRNETHIEEFTMLSAWKFFIEICMENYRADRCAIEIKREGNHYNINQIIFDKNGKPIYKKGDFILGRSIQAYSLSDDVVDFMDGNQMQFIHLSTLLKN